MSFLPSEKCAWIFVAPSTTWLLVTMTPSPDTHEAGTGGAALAGTAVVDDGDDRGNVGLQDGGDVAARRDLVGGSHDHVVRPAVPARSWCSGRRTPCTSRPRRARRRRHRRVRPRTPGARLASDAARSRPGSRAPGTGRRWPDVGDGGGAKNGRRTGGGSPDRPVRASPVRSAGVGAAGQESSGCLGKRIRDRGRSSGVPLPPNSPTDRANRTRESFRGPRGRSVVLFHQRRRRPRRFPRSCARGVLFLRHELCQATPWEPEPLLAAVKWATDPLEHWGAHRWTT